MVVTLSIQNAPSHFLGDCRRIGEAIPRITMRITSLTIENFRAIRNLQIHEVQDATVIAGPNGCGKSSVFDAIRLLKSAYGQYFQDEWNLWFREFQLPARALGHDATSVLFDPKRNLKIRLELDLTDGERAFLSQNAGRYLEAFNWNQRVPASDGPRPVKIISPTQRRMFAREVRANTARMALRALSIQASSRASPRHCRA
jgi:predicted ATP-dependent endonuclease of OLD family